MTWGYVYEGKFVRQEVALKVATVNEEFLLNAKRAAQLADGTIKEFPHLSIPKRRTRPISLDFKSVSEIAKQIEAELLTKKNGC